MINPKKFKIDNKLAFFIWDLWIVMNFIFDNKIINYDIKSAEKYDNLILNTRIKENLEYWPIYEKIFLLINSIEKITRKNFTAAIKMGFPEFDEKDFFKNCEENFKNVDKSPKIFLILLWDYQNEN